MNHFFEFINNENFFVGLLIILFAFSYALMLTRLILPMFRGLAAVRVKRNFISSLIPLIERDNDLTQTGLVNIYAATIRKYYSYRSIGCLFFGSSWMKNREEDLVSLLQDTLAEVANDNPEKFAFIKVKLNPIIENLTIAEPFSDLPNAEKEALKDILHTTSSANREPVSIKLYYLAGLINKRELAVASLEKTAKNSSWMTVISVLIGLPSFGYTVYILVTSALER